MGKRDVRVGGKRFGGRVVSAGKGETVVSAGRRIEIDGDVYEGATVSGDGHVVLSDVDLDLSIDDD